MNTHTIKTAVTTATIAAAALGGTALAAASVDSSDIVNNSISSKDVKDNSLTSTDVKDGKLKGADLKDGTLKAKHFKAGELPAGAQGPAGATGPQGPAGATGPQGPPGPAGATDVVARRSSLSVPPGTLRALVAECQPGEIAVGGGGAIVQVSDQYYHGGVASSTPWAGTAIPADGTPATGWSVVARNEDGVPRELQATALCVRP